LNRLLNKSNKDFINLNATFIKWQIIGHIKAIILNLKSIYLIMKKAFIHLPLLLCGMSGMAQTLSFSDTLFFTGSEQQYVVPECASDIVITAYGAQGAAGSVLSPSINSAGLAGKGNRVTGGWSNLTPGETLYVYVGGAADLGVGGYNGGGNGTGVNGQYFSGGGGGATDIRYPTNSLAHRVQVAGGGGGGGNAAYHWSGNTFTGGNG
jgi:hypothetical protein